MGNNCTTIFFLSIIDQYRFANLSKYDVTQRCEPIFFFSKTILCYLFWFLTVNYNIFCPWPLVVHRFNTATVNPRVLNLFDSVGNNLVVVRSSPDHHQTKTCTHSGKLQFILMIRCYTSYDRLYYCLFVCSFIDMSCIIYLTKYSFLQ